LARTVTPDISQKLAQPEKPTHIAMPNTLRVTTAFYRAGPDLRMVQQPAKVALPVTDKRPAPHPVPATASIWATDLSTTSAPVSAPTAARSARNPLVQIYAYSFWRFGGQGSGLAAAGQYGGSQTGVIATFPLGRKDNAPAAMFRATIAPDSRADREVAAGLRWRPVGALPVSITAERRFRPVGRDRFALYLAGGKDGMKLPAQFALDVYAQAGVVSGQGAGPFFDTAARASRRVYQAKSVSATIGGGVWAGGQRGAARLDIGPSIGADLALGNTRFRLTGDWRFRVAGQARPGNGPAVTLSTSF
jgi:hypothetical protein